MNLLIFFIILSSFISIIKTYLVKHHHKDLYYFFPTILKKYNTLEDMSPEIRYLKAEIGEIFIMNSLLYHCSDPYILNSNRRALNIRILHNPNKDLKIFSPNNNYTKLLIDKHDLIHNENNYIFKGKNKNMKYKLL